MLKYFYRLLQEILDSHWNMRKVHYLSVYTNNKAEDFVCLNALISGTTDTPIIEDLFNYDERNNEAKT